MAFIATGYALYTVFDNIAMAVFFSFIWGLLIFSLDPFIVSSIKKGEDKMDEFVQVAPRVVLAIIIAVVISKPLELKIFEKEIDSVLLQEKNAMTLANQEQVGLIYAHESLALEQGLAAIDSRVAQKEAEVEALYGTYIAEAEDRAGTQLLGKGPVYQEKRDKHDAALTNLAIIKSDARQEKQVLVTALEDLRTMEKSHLAETQPVIDGFDGLMARIGALGTLP